MLRHAAACTAFRTQEYGKLVSYLMDIQKELGMESATHVIDRLRSLRQSEVNLQLLREQQWMLNATVRRMKEQTELARQEREVVERRAEESAQALTDVREALNFPVDTVNRSLLFTNFWRRRVKSTGRRSLAF